MTVNQSPEELHMKYLDRYPPERKFNLPKVEPEPPLTPKEKSNVNALECYCMDLRWMVRNEEPDLEYGNSLIKRFISSDRYAHSLHFEKMGNFNG